MSTMYCITSPWPAAGVSVLPVAEEHVEMVLQRKMRMLNTSGCVIVRDGTAFHAYSRQPQPGDAPMVSAVPETP